MTMTATQIYRFTCDEFDRMGDDGFFKDKRVELVNGVIVEMSPQKDLHAAGVLLVCQALTRAMPGHLIRPQLPLTLGKLSEPEPDVSVVTGKIRDYVGTGHPTSAVLVVEVSDSTLAFDRDAKASMYAAAGIADYWILNLVDRQLEVHRSPMAGPGGGHRYGDIRLLAGSQSVATLVNPGALVLVADLLP